jgi:hypothetical protein
MKIIITVAISCFVGGAALYYGNVTAATGERVFGAAMGAVKANAQAVAAARAAYSKSLQEKK